MTNERIKVIAHAGYRGEESPRAFVRGEVRIEVMKLLDLWTEENALTGRRRRCFRVKGSDWRTYTLCHDEAEDAWHLG
ncbi:hypothetical protein [Geobacter sp.]|uniref:hypothetical protein n=1 Tax=Geobacter sp. TaxID=46610 RepID=UPI002627655A|nr:hypothetical protein [Geobacter sp.]